MIYYDIKGDVIIFIDEIDALATSRDSQIHEASRRTLGVLLRRVDGFSSHENSSHEKGSKTLLICATNRMQDLDAALLSRFDSSVRFVFSFLFGVIFRFYINISSYDMNY